MGGSDFMRVKRRLLRVYFNGNGRRNTGNLIPRFFSSVILSIALESQSHGRIFSLGRGSLDWCTLSKSEAVGKRKPGSLYPMNNVNLSPVTQPFFFLSPLCTLLKWTEQYVSFCERYTHTHTHRAVLLWERLQFSRKRTARFTLFSRAPKCQSCDALSQLLRDWLVTVPADLYGEVKICHCA